MKKIFLSLAMLIFSTTAFAGGTPGVFATYDKVKEAQDWGMIFGYTGDVLGGDFFLSNGLSGLDGKIGYSFAPKVRVNIGAVGFWGTHHTALVDVAGVPVSSTAEGSGGGLFVEAKISFLFLRYSEADMLYTNVAVRNIKGLNVYGKSHYKQRLKTTWVGITAPF